MGKYQVTIFQRPDDWNPESADDVPLDLVGPIAVLGESDDLFEAVGRAMEHNESPESRRCQQWAVVVEPGGAGHLWPAGRLCTPITYQVTPIWWPDGWEPNDPLDVPNCVQQTEEPKGSRWLEYPEAEATMLSLNRQCMDHPGRTWFVVVAIENEAVSRTVSYDAAGTETVVEVRCTHAVRPQKGRRGDCSHCPAGDLECARDEWTILTQTVPATRSRPFEASRPLK